MGSIRERPPGVFELIVSTGRDPATGKYKQVSRTVRGGIRDARRALAALEADVARGAYKPTTATMDDLFARWLPELERLGRSPATVHGYRQKIAHDISPAIGAVKVAKLRPGTLNDLYAALAARGLKAKTIRQVHAIVSSALSHAVMEEWIDFNPAKRARPPSAEVSEPVPPSPSEVLALMDEAFKRSPDMARIIAVAALTGARRGELCALRCSDIDWPKMTVRIARSVVDVPSVPLVEKDTKNHQPRRLSIDGETAAALRVQISESMDRARLFGAELIADPFVWSDEPDGSVPLRPYAVTYFFRRLRDELGMPHVTFHRLRHFMVSYALDAGIAMPTVAARAGHDPSLMMRVYAHRLAPADRAAAAAVGALLARPVAALTEGSEHE